MLSVAFGYVFFLSFSIVTISSTEVTLSFMGIKRQVLKWEEINELALIGEKVFTRKPEKTGDLYVFFSKTKHTEEEIFNIIVKWPPTRDIIYAEYSKEFLEKAKFYYQNEPVTYNIGNTLQS